MRWRDGPGHEGTFTPSASNYSNLLDLLLVAFSLWGSSTVSPAPMYVVILQSAERLTPADATVAELFCWINVDDSKRLFKNSARVLPSFLPISD